MRSIITPNSIGICAMTLKKAKMDLREVKKSKLLTDMSGFIALLWMCKNRTIYGYKLWKKSWDCMWRAKLIKESNRNSAMHKDKLWTAAWKYNFIKNGIRKKNTYSFLAFLLFSIYSFLLSWFSWRSERFVWKNLGFWIEKKMWWRWWGELWKLKVNSCFINISSSGIYLSSAETWNLKEISKLEQLIFFTEFVCDSQQDQKKFGRVHTQSVDARYTRSF